MKHLLHFLLLTGIGSFSYGQCANLTCSVSTTTTVGTTCTGSITPIVTGGPGPYTYSYSPPPATTPTSSTLYDLCAGTYTIIVADANGCTAVGTGTVTVEPSTLDAHLSVSNDTIISCAGGAISFPTGGTSPYTYVWSTGSSDNAIYDLCAGDYSLTVFDGVGDSVVELFTVTAPPVIEAGLSFSQDSAFSCTGAATVSPEGGAPPYTYVWSTGSTADSVFDLCPGSYSVSVYDIYWNYATEFFTITTPLNANLSFGHDTTSNCSGWAASFPSGGTAPYSYSWSTGASGFSLNDLCPDIYSVTVFDASGDSVVETFIVADPNTLYDNTPYLDSVLLGNLDAGLVENCVIDYNSVDSAALYDALIDSLTQSIILSWAIYSPTDTIYVTDTLSFTGTNGVYSVSISLYCPQKSAYHSLVINDQVYIGPGMSLLGINHPELSGLAVYPNPFSDHLTVALKEKGNYTVSLADGLGRIIFHSEFMQTDLLTIPATSTLNAGTYFLKIESEAGMQTVKVVR